MGANATVTGNETVGGTLGVTGATTLAGLTAGASTLASAAITGNATVGGTLGVTGNLTGSNATFTGNVTATNFNGNLVGGTVSGTTGTFSSNVTVGGTLGVTGATTLAGLTAGASTLASATVTGNETVGGTLGVTGATTLAGLTAGASTLASAAITGNATVGGTLGVTGNLTGSNATFTGNVTATNFNGNLVGGTVSGTTGTFTGNVSANSFTQNGNAVLDAATIFGAAVASDATVTGTYNALNIQLKPGVVGTTEIADATQFALFTADDANTISLTDGSHAMTIAGGTNVHTAIAGNTLTISASVLTDGTTMLGDGTNGNKIRINLTNPNTWTGTQTFSAAGSGLVATTNADFRGNIINSTGDVTVNDNLVVTGTTNLQGAVTANNGITVTAGGINVTGGATIQGGATIATGDFNMATGNIYAGDGTVNVTSNTEIGTAGSRKDLKVYGSTILGYQTAANTVALNGLANAAVVGYTGSGPINLTDLPAGTANGQILWLVNLTGGVLVVDGVNVANNEMLGFVYAAAAWHRMP
jgi:hypothetical protein